MAEFKLGRIRFVWKSDWVASTAYYKDDVISYGGRTYLCVSGHTSASDFYTDLDVIPSKWNKFADGQEWKGDWAVSTLYKENDIVKNGGFVYICNNGHTSANTVELGLESNQENWDLFGEGFDWKNDWTVSTSYRLNDVVRYGANVYVCNNPHLSAATESLGLEDAQQLEIIDVNITSTEGEFECSTAVLSVGIAVTVTGATFSSGSIVGYTTPKTYYVIATNGTTTFTLSETKDGPAVTTTVSTGPISGVTFTRTQWDLLSSSVAWKGEWITNFRYRVNDVVKYGGQTYVCNTGHTSAATIALGLEDDETNWDYFNKGIEYLGNWNPGTRYKVNDLVKYGSGVWKCNTEHTSIASFNFTSFEQFVEGIEFEGFWLSNTTYQPGDIVRYGGYSYISKTVHTNVVPTDTDNWDLFATSFKWEGEYSPSTEYLAGMVVRHGGYTYTAIATSTGANPATATSSWSRLNSGLRWRSEWLNSTAYLLGDIVKFNSSSYICVLGHTSDDDDSTITPTGNSPEKDNTGTYWNLITSGLEESVLSTVGDLVYYSNLGPARLPIGEEGQVLAVENGLPEWRYWGQVENVLYVAPHGIDSPYPVYGSTIDKPWSTVRYANEQIEKGIYNTSAAYLLKQNRTFIQKEIVEWVNYQIAGGAGIWAGFTNDNIASCQRDMGLIIDAIVYDLTHGGNARTIAATETYFNPAGTALIAAISDEEEQLILAINYGVSLIDSILNNLAPAANYQALNGITVGNRIKQIIDFTYDSETGTVGICTALAAIITDALAAGNTSGLPKLEVPGYTINVKTGQYYEVLPISIPSGTAITGDELRSTRISPAGSLIATNDKAKSVAVLQQLKNVTDDIITNTAITPTLGNIVPQNTTGQKAGNVGSTTAVSSIDVNITEIKDILANGLGSVNAFVLPSPTNWGTSLTNTAYASTGNVTGSTSTYNNARAQIAANTAFIKAEITAWIAVQVAGNIAPFTTSFTYDAAACARDVEYILDAIRYDITYGGNTQTRIAADAYYSYGEATFGSGQKAPTLAAFARLKTVVGQVVTEAAVSVSAGNALTQDTSGTPGNASADNFAEERVQQIIDTITADGTLPTLVAPATSWVSTALLTARTALNSLKATVQTDSVTYIKREFPTLNFNETTCSRDVGYIVDALGYDLMFGSNFASIKAGMAYRRGTSSALLVVADQLAATLGIIDFIGHKTKQIAASGATVAADRLWDYVIDYVNTGTRPIVFGTNEPVTDTDLINGAKILELNKEFMAAEATAYVANTFRTTVSAADGGTETFTCSSQTWLVAGDTIRFTGTVFGGVALNTTYYVLAAGLTATTFRVSLTLGGTAVNLSVGSGTMVATWYYSEDRCKNDVRNYVDAIAKDLVYTGNFNSVLAARYYRNALTGSKLEDMFYVRNGCGLRNCTLTGLDGTSDGNTAGAGDADGLSAANDYGTRRPLAGAYVSLDPGWGPNDTRAWVTNKSTYVQNVSTFGVGCTGQKIDGSLHAGGNDSIVSNDFTQVLSDGIGAWITNLGRAELVSVFSYYNHIGYLAENGGKIRATNGNNSYGTFGSVAEGFDVTETPTVGKINNRANDANVRSVLTDGNNVQLFEYLNAGNDYSLGTFTISGAGSAAATVGNEVRNGGVFNIRLTDPGDSTGPGGVGYVTASNVAQGGNATQITIAAADTALSTAYVGMHLFITSGTGAGQYGYINSYNSGSKIATIYKESTGTPGWDHVIPGTPILSALDLTTSYEITPRVSFTDPAYTRTVRSVSAARNWNDLVFGDAAATYTGVAATGGSGATATVDITRLKGSYTVTINAPGFNYLAGDTLTVLGTFVGGATPANDITITVEASDDTDGSLQVISATGAAINPAFIAVAAGTNQAGYSVDGITWSSVTLPSSQEWFAIAYGKVNNVSRYVAISRQSQIAAWSIDGVNWNSSSIGEGGDWCDIAYGNGRFVVVSESDSSTTSRAVTLDGAVTWSVGSIATGAVAIAYGNGRFVIVEGNFSNAAASSTDGITWSTATLPANVDGSTESNWRDIAFGNGRFVAIADSAPGAAYSFNGSTWYTATLPSNADWRHVSYGNGVFFAVADGEIAASSNDGVQWTLRSATVASVSVTATNKDDSTAWAAGTLSASGNWYSVGFGNNTFVAVRGGSLGVAYSTNLGSTWTNATGLVTNTDDARAVAFGGGTWVIPYYASNDVMTSTNGITWTYQSNVLTATRNWSAATYGNGRFVVIGESSSVAQYSTDGVTWLAGTMPSTDEWTSIAYGNIGGTNYFVAVSGITANSTVAASSTDGGATWTSRTLPTSTRWSSVTFGNSRFVAVAGNSGTTTTSAAYSTNGTTWTTATMPGAAARWTNVTWNGSVFVATAYNSNRSAVSENGITWTEITMTTTANWIAGASDGAFDTVVVGFGGTSARTQYYRANTNLLTVASTTDLSVNDTIQFTSGVIGGLSANVRYFVSSIFDGTRFSISSSAGGSNTVLTNATGTMAGTVGKLYSAIAYGNVYSNSGFVALSQGGRNGLAMYAGARTRGRAGFVADGLIREIWIHEPGSNYSSAPTMTITDPNNTGADATHVVRIGNGVLAQPTFTNRGANYTAASVTVTGDGYADNYQVGAFIEFKDLSAIPVGGSNLQIAGIDDVYYRIVNVRNLIGVNTFTAQIQVSPNIGTLESPEHEQAVTIRRRYSQVRLTGHDFLDIGTGNQTTTNYPNLPLTGYDPIPANETVDSAGGRVFFTSTDQDGNFRVGGLFNVEQSTGTATLNADAFNLAGLNELSLGELALGGSGATITEFSTDPFFTADSDSVIPTQRAIKAYISSQIGGGGSSLNVNTLTAGVIFIAGQQITTTTSVQININSKVNFTAGIDGYPVALNLFLLA